MGYHSDIILYWLKNILNKFFIFKSVSLSLLEPSGPVQGCNGIALTFMDRSLEVELTPCFSQLNFHKDNSGQLYGGTWGERR
jgi:hypothetical protein